MKRLLIFLFGGLILSSNCLADWQILDKNDEYELYIESNSVKHSGNIVAVTWMYNYYKQNRMGNRRTGYYKYQSFSFDEELNCSTNEHRLFSSSPYSYAMGNGLIKVNTMSGKWQPIGTRHIGVQKVYSVLCR